MFENKLQPDSYAGKLRIMAGLTTMLVITACGGGGDGNSGADTVQYNGNTTAADITEENAKALTNQTFTGVI